MPALPWGPTYSCISLQRAQQQRDPESSSCCPAVPSGRVAKAAQQTRKLWFHLAKQQKFQKWSQEARKQCKKKKPLWHVSISTLRTEISWLASSLHCTGTLNPPGSNNFEDTPRRVESGAGTKTPIYYLKKKIAVFTFSLNALLQKQTFPRQSHWQLKR